MAKQSSKKPSDMTNEELRDRSDKTLNVRKPLRLKSKTLFGIFSV